MANRRNNSLVMGVVVVVAILILLGIFGFGSRGYGMMSGYSNGFMSFGAIGIIAFIAAIWVIYDVFVNNKGLSDGMKALWVVCAIFFSIITAIIYYLAGRNKKNDFFRKK